MFRASSLAAACSLAALVSRGALAAAPLADEAPNSARSSQDTGASKPHALYVEGGGAAVLYSVNYEYRPLPSLGLHAGLGAFPLCLFGKCAAMVGAPLSVHGFLGEGNHRLEVGAGVSLWAMDDNDARFWLAELGYRYESDGGFLFRATFTPLFRMNKPSDILPWGGISVGRTL